MKYYKVVLLKSSAPELTYSFLESLEVGCIVSVPLKSTVKNAVVLSEVQKPQFETAVIVSESDKIYSSKQMEIAKFISEYYFSSFSEAISLFLPFGQKSVKPFEFSIQKNLLYLQCSKKLMINYFKKTELYFLV